MKSHLLRIVNVFIIVLFTVSISCEKVEYDYNNEDIKMKSQEITSYLYEIHNGVPNYSLIVPCKLYVKGGVPEHSKGDYTFKLVEGYVLPDGLALDPITGVIYGNDKKPDNTKEKVVFEIEATDGYKSARTTCTLNTEYVTEGKFSIPPFQFNTPETSLISVAGSAYYAVSFSVLGGKPPYKFSLVKGKNLPGDLTLNPTTGVIAGNIKDLKKGEYFFHICCTDSEGYTAVSYCTGDKYEEFDLIIK